MSTRTIVANRPRGLLPRKVAGNSLEHCEERSKEKSNLAICSVAVAAAAAALISQTGVAHETPLPCRNL